MEVTSIDQQLEVITQLGLRVSLSEVELVSGEVTWIATLGEQGSGRYRGRGVGKGESAGSALAAAILDTNRPRITMIPRLGIDKLAARIGKISLEDL